MYILHNMKLISLRNDLKCKVLRAQPAKFLKENKDIEEKTLEIQNTSN